MTIQFTKEVSRDLSNMSGAVFEKKDGTKLFVDRDRTYFAYEDGHLCMFWEDVFTVDMETGEVIYIDLEDIMGTKLVGYTM